MMKCVLVGYPGSRKIVNASKYLIAKYLPSHFKILHIDYDGPIQFWSKHIIGFLSLLNDEYIIFSLDDYLIADYLDVDKYGDALGEIGGDVVSIKLCNSTKEEHEEYPVTTQWTIWDREYLISLLAKVQTPWGFEMDGSKLFDKKTLHRPCLEYFTNSSVSSRWEGIRLDGLKNEDREYIIKNGLITIDI